MPVPINEKLIRRQINHWNSLRRFLEPGPGGPAPSSPPIITISRLAGSGGRTLAGGLAERLGLPVHDRSLVERIARDSNLEQGMVNELDETEMNQARLWVRGVLNQKIFLRDQYHEALVRTVTALAGREGGIFLGRGAHHILGLRADLRVRLVAPLGARLDRLCRRTDLSRAEARAWLDSTDRRRARYTRQVFHREPGQAGDFDLILNTERMSPATVLEMTMTALLENAAGDPDGLLVQAEMTGS